MADPNNEEPSALPWYYSPVQRAAVGAAVSGAASLIIQLLGVNIDVAIVNVKIGLVLQLVNLGFGVWAIVRRANSSIQPLTLTKAAADVKSDEIDNKETK